MGEICKNIGCDFNRENRCANLNACGGADGSVLDTLCHSDAYCVDAAAYAWINGGGDADGVEYMWSKIRDRVRELSK
jgi:hypothetical protein